MTGNQKNIAISFLELVVENEIEEAYKKYVSKKFIHHNPYFEGSLDSLRSAMEENAKVAPNKKFEIKLALEEKNLVSTYSHIQQSLDDIGMAVVHIFRIVNKKIVELLSVAQSIPEDSPNLNGMF